MVVWERTSLIVSKMPSLILFKTFPDDLILHTAQFGPNSNPVSNNQAPNAAGLLVFWDAVLQGKQNTSAAWKKHASLNQMPREGSIKEDIFGQLQKQSLDGVAQSNVRQSTVVVYCLLAAGYQAYL